MPQGLLNNVRTLYKCNDPDAASTFLTTFNFTGEYIRESLRLCNQIGLRVRVFLFLWRLLWKKVLTKPAVGRKHLMKSGRIGTGSEYRRSQASYKC